MRQKRFFIYLFIQLAIILFVMLIFKWNADIKKAATLAGVLFVIAPVALLMWEWRQTAFENSPWMMGVLQFWLLFALPILGLRLFNWDTDFKDLSFLGVPGPVLHTWSSKSYTLMMAVTLWQALKMAWLSLRSKDHKNKRPV